MGQETQLHLGKTLDSQSSGIYECFIYDQDDKGFCIVSGKTSECQELIKKKDLIITAVNVMPEVISVLRCVIDKVIDNPLRLATFEDRCERLLKRLEGVDVD